MIVQLDRRMRPEKRQRGGAVFQLLIVLTVGAAIVVSLLEREEFVEKAFMEATVRNMRSGLMWRVAELMAADRMGETGQLLNENPVNWLQRLPTNYIGQLNNPKEEDLPRGNWYFDSSRRELVYVPENRRFFVAGPDGARIRYRVVSDAGLPETDLSQSQSKVEGVRLVLENRYKWF